MRLRLSLVPIAGSIQLLVGCGDPAAIDASVPPMDSAVDISVVDSAVADADMTDVDMVDAVASDAGTPTPDGGIDGGTDAATPPSDSGPRIDVGTPPGFRPCGATLWSWAWAGEEASNLMLTEPVRGIPRVIWMGDLSGNERHYYNEGRRRMGFHDGFTFTENDGTVLYTTNLPVVMANGRTNYSGQMLQEGDSLNADGAFYLAFAGLNTRIQGSRVVWGNTPDHNIGMDQRDNRIWGNFGGTFIRLTEKEAVPRGGVILEVWRDDDDDVIHVRLNGVEGQLESARSSAVFDIIGVGAARAADPDYSSAWDDGAFEYIVCRGNTPPAAMDEVMHYLGNKWGIPRN